MSKINICSRMKEGSEWIISPEYYTTPGSSTYYMKDMSCVHPARLYGKFTDWKELDLESNVDTGEQLLDADIQMLITRLVKGYTTKVGDTSCCFTGYGGDKYHERRCPVCGGVLIAEASALCVREVSLQGLKVPIVLCMNCSEAFAFTNVEQNGGVYFTLEGDLLQALKNDEEFELCFDFWSDDKRLFNIKLTALHRLLIYALHQRALQL